MSGTVRQRIDAKVENFRALYSERLLCKLFRWNCIQQHSNPMATHPWRAKNQRIQSIECVNGYPMVLIGEESCRTRNPHPRNQLPIRGRTGSVVAVAQGMNHAPQDPECG